MTGLSRAVLSSVYGCEPQICASELMKNVTKRYVMTHHETQNPRE